MLTILLTIWRPGFKGVFKEVLVVGMRGAFYSLREIFEFSDNSKFSISPEKAIPRQN